MPTVNITSGCAHGCLYCYGQGYRQYPGANHVLVYGNTAEQVRRELRRKRTKPRAVYFCPSCDAFQPVPEVLEQSYQTMTVLLEHGVGVALATKGAVPEKFVALFESNRRLVSVQIGLSSLDPNLMTALEPGAASVPQRLGVIDALRKAGVAVAVRADPMIYGLTDGVSDIRGLLEACRDLGVKHIAASYLFLRPAIRAGLRRGLSDRSLLDRALKPYETAERLLIRGGTSGGLALPTSVKREGYERLRGLAEDYGVTVHVCGCKNPDLTSSRCHLAGFESGERRGDPEPTLPLLQAIDE